MIWILFSISDRVVVLAQGSILADGTVEEVGKMKTSRKLIWEDLQKEGTRMLSLEKVKGVWRSTSIEKC